ncbi:MAG TPA: acyl-CoA dehydrogenase family protein [Acidimicrobiales bacterium]|nr:acyl-CoA dehydrogenase family protein [Acidimicrobiales bacterium]
MDLTYSEDDEKFRAELRAWLDAEVPAHGPAPKPDDWDARRAYDTGWQRRLFDAGFAGIHWPKEFGGQGRPVSQQLVYLEEYARAGAPHISVNFVGMMHAGPTLIAEGTPDQQAFHLPRILRGDSVWCQGFSEPNAGSDLASLTTSALRHGDEYRVNGQKIWSTRAHVADYCELLVRTDSHAPKHKGITWLILDMHQPGVEVRPLRTLDGESHFCELYLTDARVPIANRVGAENDGWRVTNVTLRFERSTAFAQHIITLRSQLRELVSWAFLLPGHTGSAWNDPALRRELGRLSAHIEGLWRMTQRCVTEADATGSPAPSGSAVKLRYSELSQELSDLAMRMLGRLALGGVQIDGIDAAAAAKAYLWSLQYTIAAGTSQIQRNLIAERILGMPRSP